MNPCYKALLFDFGGTLDSDGVNWKDRFYPFYIARGLKWPYKSFERYFFKSDDALCEKTLHRHSFQETILLQVTLLLKAARAYDQTLAKQIAEDFVQDSLLTLKRNIALLKKLKKKYRLGIVSNFYGNLAVLCKEFGYAKLFDVIIDSARVGVSKPDPNIFWEALKELDCAPEEAVFIGDSHSRDMAGAKTLRMRHIWLKARGLKVVRNLKPCCKGDCVISSLQELEKVLL